MKKAGAILCVIVMLFSLAGTAWARLSYYKVDGYSMNPELQDGDVIEIVSEQYQDGDMVVAVKKDGTKIVKRLMGDRLVSVGDGTSYSIDEVTILGAAKYTPMTLEELEAYGFRWETVLAEGEYIVQVAAGYEHSLALTNTGVVYAWGRNQYGQLGNVENEGNYPRPVQVKDGAMGNSGVEAIAAGGEFSLAIKKGKVYSWGWNAYGQLGDGTKNNYDTPVKVNKLENAEKPVIKPLPEEIVVNEGAEETLTVEAEVSDGGTLSYQWYRNTENDNTGGTKIDGATDASFIVPADVPGTFYYYVEVTNTSKEALLSQTAKSNVVKVIVRPLNAAVPVITSQPTGTTVVEGEESLTLTVEAEVSDGGALSYQWYRNTENSNTGGTEIDGATERSYSVPTDVPGTFYYYVEITNTNSNAVNPTSKITSDVATVIVLPASGQGGAGGSGGSGGGGSEPDESVSPGSTELPLIINGQPYDSIVTGQVTEEDGITKVTATIDKAKLENLLQNEGDNPVIIIPAAAIDADQVVSVLTAETVKIMEDKHAVLEIRTVNGNYKLPAERIAIDRVAAEFGESVDLSQITINVEISRSDASKAQLAETAAENGNFTVIVPPVDFTVTATYNDQTVEIGRFTGYVEREIPIPEGVDANQITIAVVIEDDGTARHVPTYVIERDGVYYAVVLSLTNSTYTLIWNKKEFADVKNHWSQDEVNDLASRLVIRGTSDTMFSPNQNITRAQFAAIIVRALGLSDKGGISPFADVRADDWFAGAVAKAHEYGLLQGYGDGTFRPRNLITRQEAMAILRRALKWTELSGDANDVELTLSRFADHAQVAGWAKEAVATMVEKGIVQGSEGKLNPYGQLTRAEAAAMVHRMLKKSGLID